MSGTRRALLVAAAWLLAGRAAAAELPELVAAAKPSVLPVGTYNATDSPRFSFRGTGFVVGDGSLLATNAHVLPEGAGADSGPQLAAMVTRGGSENALRRLRVVALDRPRDLALLSIEGAPLTPLVLAEDGSAREGQSVALIGYPIAGILGFAPVTHRGIIASITTAAQPAPTARVLDPRALAKLREGNFEVYQLDATAYPGNSGGPLIDATNGRVLGIVNMVLVKGSRESALSSPTGITYAIPITHLRDLLRTR